jgi:hypothetical protein
MQRKRIREVGLFEIFKYNHMPGSDHRNWVTGSDSKLCMTGHLSTFLGLQNVWPGIQSQISVSVYTRWSQNTMIYYGLICSSLAVYGQFIPVFCGESFLTKDTKAVNSSSKRIFPTEHLVTTASE